MNKMLTKLTTTFIGMAMAIGVGVAVASNSREATPVHAADTELTFSLTSNPGDWPTSSSAGNYNYTLSGTTYTFALGTNVYCNSGYLMLKYTTSLGLPAISGKKLTKIVASNSSGCSTATRVGVSSSSSSASYITGGAYQTWSTQSSTYTYNLTSTSANTMYYLYVTNKNCQITQLELTYASDSTPLTGITLGGAASQNALSIGSSDLTAKTVSVTLNPLGATDQQVNIAHQSGTNGLFTKSASQITCTSGSGSFTLTGTGATSGSETFRISGNTETSVYVDLVVTALDDSAIYYTVSFDSDGGSLSPDDILVEEDGTFEFPSPGTKTNYTFDGWTSDVENYYDAGETSPAVTEDIEYIASWTENAKVTVTYVAGTHGTGTFEHTNQYVGSYTLLPFASLTGVSAAEAYRFKNYTVGNVDKNAGQTVDITEAIEIIVNFEEKPGIDEITLATTGVTKTTYADGDFSGKSATNTDHSNAAYAGQVVKSGNGYIQMRATNPGGIVSTSSGGKLRGVTITWDTAAMGTNARTVDIYGNTSAYSTGADLYSASTDGDKVGSITYTNTTTYETHLSITGDYTFVGIRSNINAVYIQQIDVEWELPSVLTSVDVSFENDPDDRTFTVGQNFTFNGTLTASYTKSSDAAVVPSSYHIGSEDGDEIDTTTVLTYAHNNASIYVVYTEGEITKSDSFKLIVNYAPVSSISLNPDSVDVTLDEIKETIALDDLTTVSILPANANQGYSWSVNENDTTVDEEHYIFDDENNEIYADAAGTIVLTCESKGDSTKKVDLEIKISDAPELLLLDADDKDIDGETVDCFTGDSTFSIKAISKNVESPTYTWENEDDDVVTLSTSTSTCTVTTVGPGTSDVSVTVGSLTRTVTFSVTQSGVSSLTLTSSVPSGELYDGTYNNTLTLTPAVTLVGNATGLINWSSNDTSVATVSSAQTTAPTAITVTGVGAGSATIIAESVYTPSKTAEFEVTVTADGVTTLSWTNRPKFNSGAANFQTIWAGETTLGDLMSQNGNYGIGVFNPTWKSAKSDTPTMGTGDHDVHIGLYDIATPTTETTPLTSSYEFQLADNNKYVVAFYEGKASGYNTQLSITKWRSVVEEADADGIYTFSTMTGSSELNPNDVNNCYSSSDGLASPEVEVTKVFQATGAIRLATGSASGTITFDFGDVQISNITIVAHGWSNSEKECTMSITNGGTITTTSDTKSDTFDVELSTLTSEITFSAAKNNRICIESITFTGEGQQQVGKSDDCLGLESFIDTYLHMTDYTSEQGWCADEEHHYYSTAKAAFNSLNNHQKSLFVHTVNNAYAQEYARLKAWAAANGESFNSSNSLSKGINPMLLGIDIANNGENILLVIATLTLVAFAFGGYTYFRKKKQF